MTTLTCVERLVLESLGNGPKDLATLMRDTQLELRFLVNILHALTLRSYVVHGEQGYAPNHHLPSEERAALHDDSQARLEAMELLAGLAHAQEKKLGLRKVWMSDKDRSILRALLKNVEDFVQTLPPPPKHAPLHQYTLVAWAEDQYGEVVKRLIAGVA